ncbi:MAG: Ig-like domain-containing protein [Promethearchaeota archaeon]
MNLKGKIIFNKNKGEFRLKILLIILVFIITFTPVNPINHKVNENDIDTTNLMDKDSKSENIIKNSAATGQTIDKIKGYSTNYTTSFDILENVQGILNKRDFKAEPSNYFNLSIPNNWTAEELKLYLESFHKNQTIKDSVFEQPADKPGETTPWFTSVRTSYQGKITPTWQPDIYSPQYTRTDFYSINPNDNQIFYGKDDGFSWIQELKNLNPDNLEIAHGRIYQKRNETVYYNNFATKPDYNYDDNNPYGGYEGTGDVINLNYNPAGYLQIEITPGLSQFGGNPSANWWSYIDIPYEVDYAEITLSWEISSLSTFEEDDDYRVIARINNKYIDGEKDFIRGDIVPIKGSDNALLVYNDSSFLRHGVITRTYNITDLIDRLTGVNKFDFGVWAKNPTVGDTDIIVANFHSIEIRYNISTKYEVASLEFDYKMIYERDSFNPGDPENLDDPNLIINNASVFLILQNYSLIKKIRVLPFNKMVFLKSSDTSIGAGDSIHVQYSLSQEYQKILKSNNLLFSLGIYFETNYHEELNLQFILDNVTFTINYKHPSVNYSELETNIDGKGFNDVNQNPLIGNVSDWGHTQNETHHFQFRTNNNTFIDILYLNIKSVFKLNYSVQKMNGAFAKYKIDAANSEYGIWNITYNNTIEYSKLLLANNTPFFNLSDYSISFLNMPAFDNNGSNSNNWEIYSAISPNFNNYSQKLFRFNYTGNKMNQSAKIIHAFEKGNWTILARQPNYIINIRFNASDYYEGIFSNTPIFYRGSYMKYNFTLKEDALNKYNGNYSIEILNSTLDTIDGYPIFKTSNNRYLTGVIPISLSYKVGKYYIFVKWNDTATFQNSTLRFGSKISTFLIYNATHSGFIKTTSSVQPGIEANFTVYYRTNYSDWGINTSNLLVYYNYSNVGWRLWGVEWTGTYQVNFTYLGDGNYSVKLYTSGTPNGVYKLVFIFRKLYHQMQNITWDLTVSSVQFLKINITKGAHKVGLKYVINQDNIPYVNDTVNSIIQINLTDNLDVPQTDAIIIGKIGTGGNIFYGIDLYKSIPLPQNKGLYNLTLDTTGLNATEPGKNKTLYITCYKDGYSTVEINVTIEIHKIPTSISLQNIDPVYEQGEIEIIATIQKYITPDNPKPVNKGTLTYYIVNNSKIFKSGTLDFLMSGVYTKTVSVNGLLHGNYTIYINGTAFNCEDSQSNFVNLEIMPQIATDINITIPSIVRVLNEFNIETKLFYKANGSVIANQSFYLNITTGNSDPQIISRTTDNNGYDSYPFIISSDYKDQNITIIAVFEGQGKLRGCSNIVKQKIYGKIPIVLNITQHPNNSVRVGYSATYVCQIDIKDPDESEQNRIILFTAYYDNNKRNPFISTQLQTDKNGICSYTINEIADGKDNITVYFEYLGSTTVAYNSTSRTDKILPKWRSAFSYEALPEIIRFGQTITFNMTFWSSDNQSLSFSGLSVAFTFKYGTTIEIYTKYIDENNRLTFDYTIADNFNGGLNVTIHFLGNNKIADNITSLFIDVKEKIKVTIKFLDKIESQYMVGTHYISVKVTDGEGNPLEGLDLIFQVIDDKGTVIYNVSVSTNAEGIASASINFKEVGDKFYIKVLFKEEGIYAEAELLSENIRVVNEFILFLDALPYILLMVAIMAASAFAINRLVIVPRRNRRMEALKQLYQKLSDVENIQYILILTKDGGVPIFSKSMANIPIDETLISGFLSAISSFGQEIGAKIEESEGGLEELSYRQFKIIVNDGKFIRVALLLLKRPSESLRAKLRQFTDTFEQVFYKEVTEFKGEVLEDLRVTPLIEKIFEADLLYPHQVVEQRVPEYIRNLPKKDLARKILIIARGEEFESNFYLRDMINHLKTKGIEEIKSFESLQKLKSDQIVFAINPRTNYLIEQLKPFIAMLDEDDRNVLFAIFDGNNDELSIRKYLKKNKIKPKKEISDSVAKLKQMELLSEENILTDAGNALATLLKLIPDL